MCNLHFKFEEHRTKTAVAIDSDKFFGQTDGRTDRQTNIQVILYLSHTGTGSAPYWSNPPFLIFDIRVLWHSVLSARAPECQKLKGGLDQYGKA